MNLPLILQTEAASVHLCGGGCTIGVPAERHRLIEGGAVSDRPRFRGKGKEWRTQTPCDAHSDVFAAHWKIPAMA